MGPQACLLQPRAGACCQLTTVHECRSAHVLLSVYVRSSRLMEVHVHGASSCSPRACRTSASALTGKVVLPSLKHSRSKAARWPSGAGSTFESAANAHPGQHGARLLPCCMPSYVHDRFGELT